MTHYIWPTEFQPDDAEGGATPEDCFEVVTVHGNTLLLSSLARCREEYPNAKVEC